MGELPTVPSSVEKLTGWKKETAERAEKVTAFMRGYFRVPRESRPQYDQIAELHFSGSNAEVMRELSEGTAEVEEVSVLYENGEPIQIHIVFSGREKGPNIDAYIQGKALTDYLAESK